MQLTNPGGRAEKLSLTLDMGMQASSQYAAAYTQPRPWGLPLLAELRVFRWAAGRAGGRATVGRTSL